MNEYTFTADNQGLVEDAEHRLTLDGTSITLEVQDEDGDWEHVESIATTAAAADLPRIASGYTPFNSAWLADALDAL